MGYKTQVNRIKIEFDDWAKKTDNFIDLSNCKFRSRQERKRKIEEMYVIRDGKEIILSAGTMLWLFLNGDNTKEYTPTKKELTYPPRVLEEMKIRHRLKLFKLNTSDFDYDKIRKEIDRR